MAMAEAAAHPLEPRIRALLADLEPLAFELEDQSAAHAGHAGARAGAHLRLVLVSSAFLGLPRVQRHRLVYERLAPLMGGGIHALTMSLSAPDEAGH
jgi:BolA protein